MIAGIDNGVTGWIVFADPDQKKTDIKAYPLPVKIETDYHKGGKNKIKRLDFIEFQNILANSGVKLLVLERPFTKFFKNAVVGARLHEAILISAQLRHMAVKFIDAKDWQKKFCPKLIGGDIKKYTSKLAVKAGLPPKSGDAFAIWKYACL